MTRAEIASSRSLLWSRFGVKTLLTSPSSNPKTAKSLGEKVWSPILHFLPAKRSMELDCGIKINFCGKEGNCVGPCLNTAGNPVWADGKERARLGRCQCFYYDRDLFWIILRAEMESHRRRARKAGMECAFRLNGTSDLCWYRLNPGLIEDFKDCMFYDYTKFPDRLTDHRRPAGYHLTFSHDGDSNWPDCVKALRFGVNVAVVFDHKQGIPSSWRGYHVIDGDQSDYRPGDKRVGPFGSGVIVGLKAKGKARTDMSGFVVRDFSRIPLKLL